jgi:4-amino-4-deoxy-L-arabinose transferase-like glycosyltransferase
MDRKLLAILIGGLVLRAALVAWFHGEPLHVDDERSFSEIAGNLANHGTYAVDSGELTSLRPPLYPGVVALLYMLFGVDSFTAVRVFNAVASLGTVVLTYQIAIRLFDLRTARWAAAFVCFYASLLFTTNLVLTESLFTFLLMLFCLCMLHAWRMESTRWYAAAGATLALAALTRSVLWLFPPFAIVFLWFALRPHAASYRLARIAALVLAFAVVLAPWSIRNSLLQKTFTTVDVMGGRNLMMGNYEHTPLYRAWDAISMSGAESWHAVLAREEPHYVEATQGQRDKLAMKRGLRFVAENPVLTAKRCVIKFFNFWQLEREVIAGAQRGYWGIHSRIVVLAIAAIVLGSYVAAMAGGIFGWAALRPSEMRFHVLALLLVGFICAVHTAVFGHSRYHLPAMPLLLIYAAAAVVHRAEIWRSRKTWQFRAAAMTYAILAASWVWEIAVVERARIQEIAAKPVRPPAGEVQASSSSSRRIHS